MDRETKTITTKNGHNILVKTYLTAREANQIKGITLSKLNYEGSEGDIKTNVKLAGTSLLDEELKILEISVVSIDGKTEKIMEVLQDMPFDEYQEVVDQAKELTKGLFPQPKSN
jgi:hypothetical protein